MLSLEQAMMRALQHGWKEGKLAAARADDAGSRAQLRRDFLFSRLLKLGRLPGYNRLREVRIGGCRIHYRFNRGDLQSLREVFLEEVYDCELPFQVGSVLDLGGNIGLSALWFSKRIKPSQTQSNEAAFIVAVEPVPENAAVAELNFRSNELPAELVRAAVGLQAGEAWFEARSESNLGRLVSESGRGSKGLRVPVVGIRELLDRFPGGKADLVKMDIEGGEEDLLGHDTTWLARVKSLLVEWHDDRADSRPLIRSVEAAGFTHCRINESRQDNLSLFCRRDA